MSKAVPLNIIQGEPLTVEATVLGVASRYPNGFEVDGEIRTAHGWFVLDLKPFITAAVVGADIVLTLALPGEETRDMHYYGLYDVFLSEPGDTDALALRALRGPVNILGYQVTRL